MLAIDFMSFAPYYEVKWVEFDYDKSIGVHTGTAKSPGGDDSCYYPPSPLDPDYAGFPPGKLVPGS